MPIFEATAQDGRKLRYEAASIGALKIALIPGYRVTGVVTMADEHNNGGFVTPLDGPSFMGRLLAEHGDELLAWLDANGIRRPKSGYDRNARQHVESAEPR